MASLEQTIAKAITIASPEVLKDSELLMNLIEDLSPELVLERKELEHIYSDEIGKLLYTAWGSKDGVKDSAWKEIVMIFEQSMGLKENKQRWFIQLFSNSFPKQKPVAASILVRDPMNESRQVFTDLLSKVAKQKSGIEKAEIAEKNGRTAEAIRIYKQYNDGSYFERKAKLRLGELYKEIPELSYQYYLRAADLGDPEAAFWVGFMNQKGNGTPVNMKRAFIYYTRAYDSGHRGAMHNLGCFYYEGSVVEKDLRIAFELFRIAAEKGKSESMRNVAFMYEHGYYVEKNLEKALFWYNKAWENGISAAEQDCQRVKKEKRSPFWKK